MEGTVNSYISWSYSTSSTKFLGAHSGHKEVKFLTFIRLVSLFQLESGDGKIFKLSVCLSICLSMCACICFIARSSSYLFNCTQDFKEKASVKLKNKGEKFYCLECCSVTLNYHISII